MGTITKEVIKTEEIITCDVCDKQIGWYSCSKCDTCGKDLCNSHSQELTILKDLKLDVDDFETYGSLCCKVSCPDCMALDSKGYKKGLVKLFSKFSKELDKYNEKFVGK